MSDLDELANKDEDQYFYHTFLRNLGERHVAWVDIMGVLDALGNDQKAPAVWRGELLTVISEYIDLRKATIFTVGDGIVIMT